MDCLVPIRLLMTGLTLIAPTVAAEPMAPETIRKVARLELARSIRAFAAGSLANGECLVRNGQRSRERPNTPSPLT